MTTMYLPNCYMLHERGTGVAARPIKPTLDEAMAVLDAEIEKVGKPPLEWREEFGGAYAQRGELAYEVTPVEVDLPDEKRLAAMLQANAALANRLDAVVTDLRAGLDSESS